MTVLGQFIICLLFPISAIAYTSVQATNCRYNMDQLKGNITSPRIDAKPQHYYPYKSPTNQGVSCVWSITVPEGYRILLVNQRFNIPTEAVLTDESDYYGDPEDERSDGSSENQCSYSWVYIHSLTSDNEDVLHGRFCGNSLLPPITSMENKLQIQYYSRERQDSSYYFEFLYETVPADVSPIVAKWISSNRDMLLRDEESLPRAITALYLFNETYLSKDSEYGQKFRSQYLLKLSKDIIRNSSRPLKAGDFSQHITALLAMCNNPRSFHGIDLVDELRKLLDANRGLASPYDILTLCNAGENITTKDIEDLKAILDIEKRGIFMMDFHSVTVMALVCASGQNMELDIEKDLLKAVSAIASYQKDDGGFGNLGSTVMAVQALYSGNYSTTLWNESASVTFINRWNHTDGSFGNLYDLFTVLPVLKGKTLLHVNVSYCGFSPNGVIPLQEVKDKMTELISITYQLRIGDEEDVRYTMDIRFPNGTTFFDAMRLAAEKDEKFQLEWTFVKGAVYVYQISGLINDPISAKYWSFSIFRNNKQLAFEEGLQEYIPRSGDTAVMWYKTVDIQPQFVAVPRN